MLTSYYLRNGHNEGVIVSDDHQEIKAWVEKYGGKPQLIEAIRSNRYMQRLRIAFPGEPEEVYNSQSTITDITWEEFFEIFDEEHDALIYRVSVDPLNPRSVYLSYQFVPTQDLQSLPDLDPGAFNVVRVIPMNTVNRRFTKKT